MNAEDRKLMHQLFAENQRSVQMHIETQKAFERIYLCALGSISDEDAARLLLETLGSEEEVKRWVEVHLSVVNNVLKRWYMTARIQAHEQREMKK